MNPKLIEDIKNAAKKSQMKFRLAAMVTSGNDDRVVGIGYNRPFVTHRLKSKGYYSIHAEVDAIRKAGGNPLLHKVLPTTMIVVRIRKDGSIGCSKPCKKCIAEMRKFGIKKVIYTDEHDRDTEMNL